MTSIAISPCPNDTFLFHAWISGKVGKTMPLNPIYADIDQLNRWAFEKKFPIIKISISCLRYLYEDYQLLPVGTALGYGCGPKLIARSPFSLEELSYKRIAIPGKETTAHHLLQMLAPSPKEKIFCLYHEIPSLLASNAVDCGLVIHESRFTFQNLGFVEIVDFGVLWEKEFQLPLPLGGIAVKRSLSKDLVIEVISYLKASLTHAWSFPFESRQFVQELAQEKEDEVIQKHINLYVTKETLQLSSQGIQAITKLLQKNWSSIGFIAE